MTSYKRNNLISMLLNAIVEEYLMIWHCFDLSFYLAFTRRIISAKLKHSCCCISDMYFKGGQKIIHGDRKSVV